MSRAFVKEEDPASPVVLPGRPVSDHPNYVTEVGYAEIQQTLERLDKELGQLEGKDDIAIRTRRAEIVRDRNYFSRRLETAEVIRPASTERVRFGHTVVFVDEKDSSHRFRIVGEDEADPTAGKLFYASPLAKALLGKQCGDIAHWHRAGDDQEIEITDIF